MSQRQRIWNLYFSISVNLLAHPIFFSSLLKSRNPGSHKGPRTDKKYWQEGGMVASELGCYHTVRAINENHSPHGGVANNQCKGWHQAGKGSRRRSGLINHRYLPLPHPLPSPLTQQPPSHFKLLCLVFQLAYHHPTHPRLRDHQVPRSGRDLWDLFQHSPYCVMNYAITVPRIKVPCGQRDLGNKAHHLPSLIFKTHIHIIKKHWILAEHVTHLILFGPTHFKTIWG